MTEKESARKIQHIAPYIMFAAASFLVYEIYLVQNSFSALYTIALSAISSWQRTGSLWPLVWLSSEISSEVGLLIRFVGACLFITVALFLLRKKQVAITILRKALLLEAVHFLFYIPFIIFLLTHPERSVTGIEFGISYALQIILVSPVLFVLHSKLKEFKPGHDKSKVVRWFAIAFCIYVLALWVKHFLFALYAVGIDFSEPVLIIGSINSMVTLLVAAAGSLLVLLPFVRGKRTSFDLRGLGAVLTCIGVYFVIFISISLVNANYSIWFSLTEWWATSLFVVGLGLVLRGKRFVAG